MSLRSLISSVLVVVWLATLASPLSAQVLLSDTFSRTTGSGDGNGNPNGVGMAFSDWGVNDNALGGTSVQTYTFDPSRGGGAQQTTNGSVAQLIAGAAQMELDLGPLAPQGYTVAFDFQRVTNGNGFIAMALGLDDTDQIENTGGFNGNAFLFTSAANGADGAVLVKQNGDLELWDGGDAPAQTIGGFYSGPTDPHSALVTINAPSGYGAGTPGTLSVSIDGGMTASQAITFDGTSSGYLSFYSNLAGDAANVRYGAIDNLLITAIPEPGCGTLVVLLGVIAACGRRWFV